MVRSRDGPRARPPPARLGPIDPAPPPAETNPIRADPRALERFAPRDADPPASARPGGVVALGSARNEPNARARDRPPPGRSPIPHPGANRVHRPRHRSPTAPLPARAPRRRPAIPRDRIVVSGDFESRPAPNPAAPARPRVRRPTGSPPRGPAALGPLRSRPRAPRSARRRRRPPGQGSAPGPSHHPGRVEGRRLADLLDLRQARAGSGVGDDRAGGRRPPRHRGRGPSIVTSPAARPESSLDRVSMSIGLTTW